MLKLAKLRGRVTAKEGEGGVITVAPATSVRTALSTITAHDIGQLPVILDGACVGSLAEGDLMARVIEEPTVLDDTVETVMERTRSKGRCPGSPSS